MRRDLLVLVVLFFFSGGCTCLESGRPLTKDADQSVGNSPNIILVSISSLRADHVSAYGYGRDTTPNFDKFANDNVFFTSAFATSSWQMPANGSILTSIYPSKHKADHINNRLSQDCPTLPGLLKENGYRTVGFTCNPRLTSGNGFSNGFDFYDDFSVKLLLDNMAMSDSDEVDINQLRTNDLINSQIKRWLDNNEKTPFFLYVHYYDNHWDYMPPAPYDREFSLNYNGDIDGRLISKEPLYSNMPSLEDVHQIIALYDGEVKQTDKDLGALLEFLEDKGYFGNTIVLILGDHGEQFYEHGNTSHHGLYDEMIRVPMALHLPSQKKIIYDGLVSQVDILPTILAYSGLDNYIPSSCDGYNLKDPITENRDARTHIYAEYTGGAIPDSYAIRNKDYKVIISDDTLSVFDLHKDQDEVKPIGPELYNEQIDSMVLKLKEYCSRSTVEDAHTQENRLVDSNPG